jgi:predicted MFS family arabinose efflux permease
MPPAGSPFIQLREGFRYARSHHVILAVFLITVVVNLFLISYMTMLPVIARDVLLLDASGLGFIGMAVGMGALPGIVIVHKVKRFISDGLIYTVGTLGFSLAIVLFATSLSFPLSFCALLLGGVGHSCFGLMQSTLILTSATDAMRSRVMGLIVVAIGIGPIGQLLVGVLASRFGAPFAVQMSASLATLAIIFVMVLLPQIWRSDSPVESRR